MLWDLIRDFFVQHVFGGVDSNGAIHQISLGHCTSFINGKMDDTWNANFGELTYKVGYYTEGGTINDVYLTASDWLSTTATAISITIIVVFCCLFIYKIIKLIGGLIR